MLGNNLEALEKGTEGSMQRLTTDVCDIDSVKVSENPSHVVDNRRIVLRSHGLTRTPAHERAHMPPPHAYAHSLSHTHTHTCTHTHTNTHTYLPATLSS